MFITLVYSVAMSLAEWALIFSVLQGRAEWQPTSTDPGTCKETVTKCDIAPPRRPHVWVASCHNDLELPESGEH